MRDEDGRVVLPDKLSIASDEDVPALVKERLRITLAGPIAEALYRKVLPSYGSLIYWYCQHEEFNIDRSRVNFLLRHYVHATEEEKFDLLVDWMAATRDFLEDHWTEVRALAKALADRKELTGEEAVEVLRLKAPSGAKRGTAKLKAVLQR